MSSFVACVFSVSAVGGVYCEAGGLRWVFFAGLGCGGEGRGKAFAV